MTGPVTTEALREALLHACFDPGAVVGPRGGLTTDEWRADACMKQLAPLLDTLQQLTAERDARGEVIASLVDELARLRAEGEGTAVVPLEPTDGMQEDGLAALEAAIRIHGKPSLPGFAAAHVYRAMVAARPPTAKEDQADA